MSKNIELDKFYTPIQTAKLCIEIMHNVLKDKITIIEYLEPSAGGGSFSNLLNCVAYDIEPQSENIIKSRFFKIKY